MMGDSFCGSPEDMGILQYDNALPSGFNWPLRAFRFICICTVIFLHHAIFQGLSRISLYIEEKGISIEFVSAVYKSVHWLIDAHVCYLMLTESDAVKLVICIVKFTRMRVSVLT